MKQTLAISGKPYLLFLFFFGREMAKDEISTKGKQTSFTKSGKYKKNKPENMKKEKNK